LKAPNGEAFAAPHITKAEKRVFDLIREAVRRGISPGSMPGAWTPSPAQMRERISRAEAMLGFKLDPSQRAAVEMAVLSRLSCIEGSAGVGKSTIAFVIAQCIGASQVFGCAIAARAAFNLGQKARIDCDTIAAILHSHQRGDLTGHRMLIVDEASMVGVEDFAALMIEAQACGVSQIVFMGDAEQLFPVEAEGAPFVDIVGRSLVPTARLEVGHRFGASPGLAKLAALVRDPPLIEEWPKLGNLEGVTLIDAEDDAQAAEAVIARRAELLAKAASPFEVAIIAPFRSRGADAVGSLNTAIRASEGRQGHVEAGDMLMCIRNAPSVSNGERALVERLAEIRGDKHTILITEAGARLSFPLGSTAREPVINFTHGAAATVHKFQGSQADHVIALIPKGGDYLFGKPLLYTAITRARKSLTIIGDVRQIPRIATRRMSRETFLSTCEGQR
jgi:exodeoxyribonuclease V alpha subunit